MISQIGEAGQSDEPRQLTFFNKVLMKRVDIIIGFYPEQFQDMIKIIMKIEVNPA